MSAIGPSGPNQENPLEHKPTTSKRENSLIRRIFASATNAFSTLALSIHAPKLIPKLTEKDLFDFALDEWLKTQPWDLQKHLREKFQYCFDAGATSLDLYNYDLTVAPPAKLLKLLPQLEHLDLSWNRLTSIDLTPLTNLKKLNLQSNRLTTIDLTTLINLELVNLSYNQLTSIDLTTLTHLKKLDLQFNRLTTIDLTPLINLEYLNLMATRLTTIDLTTLTHLEYLDLTHNQLTTIIISMVPNLKNFYVAYNLQLKALPLTLGNCPKITYLNALETQIPYSTIRSILDSCAAARGSEAASKLNPKIQVWKNYSGLDIDLSFINGFTNEEKIILYEWLTRLEKSVDFRTNQLELTKIVCNILKDLENDSFKELAFSQMAANNEDCQDRASMALNELYLSWALLSENSNLSDKERLEIIAKAGKTLALREAIAKQLAGRSDINESVETYLYYEIRLADSLGLLTCIKNMSYAPCAIQLNDSELITYVAEHYLAKAASLPNLDKLLESHEDIQNKLAEIGESALNALEALGNEPTRLEGETDETFSSRSLDWKAAAGKIMRDRDQAILQLKIQFLKDKLEIQ